MTRILLTFVSLITGISALLVAPTAWAEDNVTYEVISDSVAVANIEYFDRSERRVLSDATLPWRTDVVVVNVSSPTTEGAEVRADWRPGHVPIGPLGAPALAGRWVTVRISFRGKVVCQNTLDVGDAACYGSTTFGS